MKDAVEFSDLGNGVNQDGKAKAGGGGGGDARYVIARSVIDVPGGGGKKGGWYVSKSVVLFGLCVAAAVAAAVGLAVHYLSPACACCLLTTTEKPGKPEILGPITGTKPPTRNLRLPDNVIPVHYDLELKPDIYKSDPEQFAFTGYVQILLNCTRQTQEIVLHALDLAIGDIGLDWGSRSGQILPRVTGHSEDRERQFLKISLNKALEVGLQYRLNVSFGGPLRNTMRGLYRSSYMEYNITKWLVTSHMEPTDARTAFPCFDEPHLKATFNVTLLNKHPYTTVLSNMPEYQSLTREDGWKAVQFERTVPMPTYLLAFIVCDFEKTSRKFSQGKKNFSVYARREAIRQARYALDIGADLQDYFERYFNVTYPLPKQDLIAIPGFGAGAMENWGLITFRETALLYDVHISSTANKQRVAVVISHELAHQWFGNLVSPAWWDDLWLNEGFASYVEYLGVKEKHPAWNIMDMFLTEDLHPVLALDSLSSSHPIFVTVNNPDEISEIFDAITYTKGASVLRMMSEFLGEAVFRDGLTRYLRRHQFANARHTDLWSAFAERSHLDGGQVDQPPVADVMNTWVKQMGYPLVTVSFTHPHETHVPVHQSNDSTGSGVEVHVGPLATVIASQIRFLTGSKAPETTNSQSEYGYRWYIPFTFTFRSNANWVQPRVHWMRPSSINTTFTEALGLSHDALDWIIGNVGQFGYYRVNYDNKNWMKLLNQLSLNHTVIPVKNRAQILDDSFQIGRAGIIDQLVGIKATQYLVNETEYVPWQTATRHIKFVQSMLDRSEFYGTYQEYVLRLVLPRYNRLTERSISDQDDHQQKRLQSVIRDLACSFGHGPCLQDAISMFRAWMSSPSTNNIHADIRGVIYCYAVQQGNVSEWDFAYKQFCAANVAAEKDRLLYALTCSRESWILARTIGVAWRNISKQDTLYTLERIALNPVGRQLVWNFIRAEWPVIKEKYGGSLFAMNRLFTSTLKSFNTEYELQEANYFRANNPELRIVKRSYEQAIERIKLNIDWMKANQLKISSWLQEL